jgi:hypothetical protein
MATGVSHLSGISADYILRIFEGSLRPPFVYPLNCIEDELMSFYIYIHNITGVVLPELKALIIPSPSEF